jgi:hypothetical protein
MAILPPPKHVCHRLCQVQKAANEVPVEVGTIEEDLDITVATWFLPLYDCADPIRLHFHAFRLDNEIIKADPLHLKFPLRQLQVEACLLELYDNELDMLSVLFK